MFVFAFFFLFNSFFIALMVPCLEGSEILTRYQEIIEFINLQVVVVRSMKWKIFCFIFTNLNKHTISRIGSFKSDLMIIHTRVVALMKSEKLLPFGSWFASVFSLFTLSKLIQVIVCVAITNCNIIFFRLL
jgi:hypothetical protein